MSVISNTVPRRFLFNYINIFSQTNKQTNKTLFTKSHCLQYFSPPAISEAGGEEENEDIEDK